LICDFKKLQVSLYHVIVIDNLNYCYLWCLWRFAGIIDRRMLCWYW